MTIPQQRLILPACYHITSCGSYIDYYTVAENGERKRHMIRCNRAVARAGGRREAVRYLKRECAKINALLLAAPADACSKTESEAKAQARHPLHESARRYIESKQSFLRAATMRTYKSFVAKLTAATNKSQTVEDFSQQKAVLLLDKIAEDGSLSARSYNNNLKQARALWTWFVERGMADDNPFAKIRARKAERKRRTIISREDCRRMIEWADANLPYLSLVMLLLHSALVRPQEARMIKCEDVNLEEHHIRIKAEVAKNHCERTAALTPQVERYLRQTLAFRHSPHDYLLSTAGRPSPSPAADKRFLKDFYRMKSALKLPDNYQLYSLRDTGITSMIKSGIDDLTVMRHADHSSLKITSIYARHREISVTREIFGSDLEM